MYHSVEKIQPLESDVTLQPACSSLSSNLRLISRILQRAAKSVCAEWDEVSVTRRKGTKRELKTTSGQWNEGNNG